MSRIGKLPVPLPAGVKIKVDGMRIHVEGPKGKLDFQADESVVVDVTDGTLNVSRKNDDRRSRGIHGMTRRMIANMVHGVSQGFARTLEINGVGYRAEAKGPVIQFALGYSHPIVFQLPAGVTAKIDKQTVITIEGADRQRLGEVAAMIRGLRPPEPYKGKGVKYAEEHVRRKAGKAAGSAGA